MLSSKNNDDWVVVSYIFYFHPYMIRPKEDLKEQEMAKRSKLLLQKLGITSEWNLLECPTNIGCNWAFGLV